MTKPILVRPDKELNLLREYITTLALYEHAAATSALLEHALEEASNGLGIFQKEHAEHHDRMRRLNEITNEIRLLADALEARIVYDDRTIVHDYSGKPS